MAPRVAHIALRRDLHEAVDATTATFSTAAVRIARALLLTTMLAASARAADAPPGVPFALSMLAAGVTSGAALSVTWAMPSTCTALLGSPRPLCLAAGVAVGGALQLALSALVLPELYRLSGHEPGALRADWWRWARWPALALALGALTLTIAAAVEQADFSTGQAAMLGALAGTVGAGLSVDVLGVVGLFRGATAP